MDYRKLCNNNVSLLGFGTMRFLTDEDKTIIEKKAEEIVDYAYNNGVNYFDTAYFYLDGQSERFIGQALSKYDRESYYLATKMPLWLVKDEDDVKRIFDEQLKKLKTPYIDYYLMHALSEEYINHKQYSFAYDFLSKKKEEGIIKHLGFSFHDTPEVLEKIISEKKYEFCQIQYNYLDYELQNAKRQVEILKENNIPIIIMEPIRGGSLAKMNSECEGIFNSSSSTASWAMRFAADDDAVKVVLSGMNTLEQVVDNVSNYSPFIGLSDEDHTKIKNVREKYLQSDTIKCTACSYCQPCKVDLNIPKIFSIYNEYLMDQNKDDFIKKIDELKIKKPCINCRKCTSDCPQKLDIPSLINKVLTFYNSSK